MTREHFEQDQKQFRDAATAPLHDIGWAVRAMRNGKKVCRAGWNGKGMWLSLVPASSPPMEPTRLAYVQMYTAQMTLVPWLCSQTDLLAEDWEEAT